MINRDKFKSIANSFRDKKVLIVGDVMLDRYYYGQTNRMSPEAPVPAAMSCSITDLAANTFNPSIRALCEIAIS